MAVTVQIPCASAVTELDTDALVGSSLDHGTTISPCDVRQRDWHQVRETTAPIGGRQEPDAVELPARSTGPQPLTYRWIGAPGASRHAQHPRVSCTPEIQGVAPSQPMSHSGLRWACSLAVVGGGSRRHLARRFAALCLLPMTQAARHRWLEALGAPWPPPEARLRPLLARAPATAWHLAGASPLGPAHGVMGVPEEQDRSLLPQEAASDKGEEARPWLPRCNDRGLQVPAACSASSPSCPEALPAGWPPARWQAAQVQTGKHLWGHLTQARRSYRRPSKARGEAQPHEAGLALAQPWGTWRWRLLKPPSHFSVEDKPARTARESAEAGVVPSFRRMSRQLGQLCDHAHSAAPAQRRRPQRRKALHALAD
jgi:hypothetical protein